MILNFVLGVIGRGPGNEVRMFTLVVNLSLSLLLKVS